MTERDRAPRKTRIFGVARLFRTPLHQPDARIQHGFEARPKRHRVAWLGGNEIHGRQTRRRDDGLVGGGEGVSGQIIGRNPYHRLPLTAMRLASKGVHPPHVQQDRPIGIIVTYEDQGLACFTSMPTSSSSSRASAAGVASPGSTLPPGNSQRPPCCRWAARRAMRTRPAASPIPATATCTTSAMGTPLDFSRIMMELWNGSQLVC